MMTSLADDIQQWYWLFVSSINNNATMSFFTGLFPKGIVSKNNTICRNFVLYSRSWLYIHNNSSYAYRYHSNTNKYVPYVLFFLKWFNFICIFINHIYNQKLLKNLKTPKGLSEAILTWCFKFCFMLKNIT